MQAFSPVRNRLVDHVVDYLITAMDEAGYGIRILFKGPTDIGLAIRRVRHPGLLTLGHRIIALLQDETPTEGHRVVRTAFLRAMEPDSQATVPLVISYLAASDSKGLHARLDERMRQPDKLPTAWIVETPTDAIALLITLNQHGVRVPQDASIICLGYHPGFSVWRPRISCYGVDELNYTRRNAGLILQIAREGGLPKQDYSLDSKFIKGDSLAAPT